MEFLIEEISTSSHQSSKKRLFSQIVGKIKWGIIQILSKLQDFQRKLTLQRELWLFGIITSVIALSMVGRDVWLSQQQKSQVAFLQQKVRDLSFQQQIIQQEVQPILQEIQIRWLQEREENVSPLLSLLGDLSPVFNNTFVLEKLQKHPRDTFFYLEGITQNYDAVFQLEPFLHLKQWQSTVTLSPQSDPQLFYVRMQPLNLLALEK